MGRIFAAVRSFLDAEGSKYEVAEGATGLRFGFTAGEHRWVVVAEAREAQDLLIVSSILPARVAEAQRGAIAELLTRVNHGLSVGNFDMDYTTGQVRFRTSLDLEGTPAVAPLLRQLFRGNLGTVGRHVAMIAEVATGRTTPVLALAAAMT